MKNVNMVLCSLILTVGLVLSSCGGSSGDQQATGKEYTSEYVCPMHCDGSGSDDKGECPVCGMDYVLNEEHKKDGHQH